MRLIILLNDNKTLADFGILFLLYIPMKEGKYMKRIRRILKSIKPTREEGYSSPLRQYLDMLWLGAFWKLTPFEYRTYRFGRKGITPTEKKSYLRIKDAEKKLRPALNAPEWAPLLSNKLLFNSYFSQRGLPLAKLYGMFHPHFGSDIAGNPLRNTEDLSRWVRDNDITQFVIKPLAGDAGTAVLVLEIKDREAGLFIDRGGKEYSLEDLARYMSKSLHYRQQGFLLEDRLIGHPDLAKYNPSSVNTCRVITFLNQEGEISIPVAVLRIGVKDRNTDNWHTGGLAAAIDPETGIIGEGVLRPEFGGTRHTSHPDSGLTFTGERVPDWEKIVALTHKAARMTPFIRIVGWDVAATPQGPVLVEANYNWGPTMVQASQGGMLTPEFRRELKKLGLSFPQ
jgi:hypothetical protein